MKGESVVEVTVLIVSKISIIFRKVRWRIRRTLRLLVQGKDKL